MFFFQYPPCAASSEAVVEVLKLSKGMLGKVYILSVFQGPKPGHIGHARVSTRVYYAPVYLPGYIREYIMPRYICPRIYAGILCPGISTRVYPEYMP